MELTDRQDGDAFLIGDDPATGRPCYYRGEPGLVTVAPPGSGKTQCHILPNLLTWRGPAVVLDVTGQLWAETSRERSKFGPVYRLDPDHPAASDHYNPFDFIRRDLAHLWADSRELAELVYSQPGTGGGDNRFWEEASVNYLAAFTCYIARKLPRELQTMATLARFASGADQGGFLAEAASLHDLPGLQNAVALLQGADERTRANVAWTARGCLAAWDDPATAAISQLSDWHPAMIREHSATLYLCMSLEKMKSHPAYIRLVAGQHLRAFMRHTPDPATPWVQFFLDEAPQLRRMEVLLQAIETGRAYHVRVWMIMQWRGQLDTAYGEKTAHGMMAACGLQAYLNPALADGTAAALSEAIGKVEHPFQEGGTRPRYTAQELAGPDWRDDVLAFVGGRPPARLRKHWFHADSALRAKAGAAP